MTGPQCYILLCQETAWYNSSKSMQGAPGSLVGTSRRFFVFLKGLMLLDMQKHGPQQGRNPAWGQVSPFMAGHFVERRLSGMSATISLLFGLLVAIVILATIAARLRIPYAILLVLGGLVLGFVPGLPTITLNPELILVLFLPPLIYSSAWLTSWREFRTSLRPILQLSLGLVLVTTLVIAVVAHAIAGLSWPVAFVLGAVVSPTDAVAASATAKQLGLPRRIVTVIEGESMVNDATGRVIYRFAVAAVVTGSFSLWQAGLQVVLVSLGGLLIGLVIAWPVAWLHRHLDDAPIEITITLLTPYAAYLLADALQVSGVLAVLSAGLYLSHQSSRFFSANTRLQANAVWNVLVFLLNGLVFLLIGLQLRSILETIVSHSLLTLVWEVLLISLAVIVVRLAWVFPAAYLPRLVSSRLRSRDPYPGWRQVGMVAWIGMRGGLSLAAALALPLSLEGSVLFPQRDLVIFFTFGVILVTLVGQGLSLGPIIRLLGLEQDGSLEQEHAQAHLVAARAALSRLDELATEAWVPQDALLHLRSHYEKKLEVLTHSVDGAGDERAVV